MPAIDTALFNAPKIKFIQLLKGLLIASFACLLSTAAWALESDKKQPLNIAADTADLNEGEGYAIYTGQVLITQGTIKIEADKVKVTFDDAGLTSLLATKGPYDGLAYMSQQAEPDAKGESALMEAWGDSIDYQLASEFLTLIGSAKLIQQGNQFSGHKILFDMPKDKVTATGGEGKLVNMSFLPTTN